MYHVLVGKSWVEEATSKLHSISQIDFDMFSKLYLCKPDLRSCHRRQIVGGFAKAGDLDHPCSGSASCWCSTLLPSVGGAAGPVTGKLGREKTPAGDAKIAHFPASCGCC